MSNYSHGSLQAGKRNTSWTKIFDYVPTGSTVLDIGCSTGELGQSLKKDKDCTVYGIELDKGDYLEAKKVLDKVYDFNIEVESIPAELTKIKFDAIIMADVIEHLVTPIPSLAKIKTLLRPGGRLIFSLPNMSHISVRLQLLSGHLIYNETGLLDKTHLHFYDFDEVKRVFGGAGFQIIDNNANMLNYPPSFLQKKLTALGLKDDGFIEVTEKDIQAQSFQFVGYCTALAGNTKPKDVVLTTETPEKELAGYIANLAEDNQTLTTAAKTMTQQIEELKQQLANANKENIKLRNRSVRVLASRAVQKLKTKRS